MTRGIRNGIVAVAFGLVCVLFELSLPVAALCLAAVAAWIAGPAPIRAAVFGSTGVLIVTTADPVTFPLRLLIMSMLVLAMDLDPLARRHAPVRPAVRQILGTAAVLAVGSALAFLGPDMELELRPVLAAVVLVIAAASLLVFSRSLVE